MLRDEPHLPGQSNRKQSKLNQIEFPVETYGLCQSTSKSHAEKYMTYLANGYCVDCWYTSNKGGCITKNDAQKMGKKSQKKKRESKQHD